MTLAELTTFFGWLSVVNIGLLAFSALMLLGIKGWASRMHAQMFSLQEEDVRKIYFNYIGNFKVLVIIFNIGPWLALTIMA